MRGSFRNSEKYGVDDAPAYFEEVRVELRIESPATPEQVRRLVEHAERGCHTAQSLQNQVEVSLSASHNGERLKGV